MDLGRIGRVHPVEDRCLAVGLRDVDRGVAANVKALPVDDRLLAALRDLHVGARLADVDLASSHLPTHGQLVRRWRCGRCRPGAIDDQHPERQRELGVNLVFGKRGDGMRGANLVVHARGIDRWRPIALDDLGHRHPAVADLVPDDTEYLVHRVISSKGARQADPEPPGLGGAVTVGAIDRVGARIGSDLTSQHGSGRQSSRQGVGHPDPGTI